MIYFRNKKILVAGGSGLVGANFVSILNKLKSKVEASFFTNIKKGKIFKKFNFLKISDCLKATKKKRYCFFMCIKKFWY